MPVAIVVKRWNPHGESQGVPEYMAWSNLIRRCTNPMNPQWKDYGGRGITVCDEWQKSYMEFLSHVGRRPTPKHTIERINNDGNYEPGNVKWALRKDQQRNRRKTWRVFFEGRERSVREICETIGFNYDRVRSRKRHGWPDNRLFDELL